MSAGILPPEEVDVDALFTRLQDELRRGGASSEDGSARVLWRNQAERVRAVSAERPIVRRPGARGLLAYAAKRLLRANLTHLDGLAFESERAEFPALWDTEFRREAVRKFLGREK